MDKYEFNLKIEQIKKLTDEGDYATALKVVDGIDWNRVRNTNLLTLAASVYEENERLDDAKDKLVMALERAPIGKRILYKLTELAVRSGDVAEAEDYYQEYSQLAPDDPGCLLLQYMIMKVKHAPYSQLIQCLELYNQYEPDEKWMYELATTYESSGRIQDAIALADRIVLMFGSSAYGIKALKLKQKYSRLTEEQRAILYPNSIANAGVHYAKEQNTEAEAPVLSRGDRLASIRYENEDELFLAYVKANDPSYEEPAPAPLEEPEPPVTEEEKHGEPVYEEEPEEPVYEEEPVPAEEPLNAGFITETDPEAPSETPEETEEFIDTDYREETVGEAVIVEKPEEDPAQFEGQMSFDFAKAAAGIQGASLKDPDSEMLLKDAAIASSKIEKNAPEVEFHPQARPSFTVKEEPVPEPADDPDVTKVMPAPERFQKPVRKAAPFRLIVEAEDDQEGLDIAILELKALHAKHGLSNGAVKTAAEKLNEKGLTEKAIEKISGKDFVIEHAGELNPEVAEQVYSILKDHQNGTNVILIDNSDGLDKLEETKAEIFDLCELITDEDAREKEYPETVPEEQPSAPVKKAPDPVQKPAPVPADDEILSIDDFAQYCVSYATGIDCTISGKSMLALYERIELMEEDGIALTKKAAEDLIEEAADRAEKPPIGKKISGLFHSKYDKDGLLILKEEDFIY